MCVCEFGFGNLLGLWSYEIGLQLLMRWFGILLSLFPHLGDVYMLLKNVRLNTKMKGSSGFLR